MELTQLERDEATRMKCLEIAAKHQQHGSVPDILSASQRMYDFVRGQAGEMEEKPVSSLRVELVS